MSVFVDTSALLAVLSSTDQDYPRVAPAFQNLLQTDEPLVSTNYVLVETLALVQRRLGMAAVRTLVEDYVPLLEIVWISSELHGAALATFLGAARRQLSFVDCSSFEAMRRRNLTRALTLDGHFAEFGFEKIP